MRLLGNVAQRSLPKPASYPNNWKRKKSISDYGPPAVSRRRLRLLLRLTVLVAVSVLAFLLFLRVHPPSKQYVEDSLRYSSDYLGIRKDKRKSLGLSQIQLIKIYNYEITAGHFPFLKWPTNALKKRFQQMTPTQQNQRTYLPISSTQRSPTGSFLDMEQVMHHCAFENKKYVVNCLAILNGSSPLSQSMLIKENVAKQGTVIASRENVDILKKLQASVEKVPKIIKTPFPPRYTRDWSPACLQEHEQKLFHIFWTGPFTDKPYLAAISFLATQRLFLNDASKRPACAPRLIFWLVPGSAYSSLYTTPTARDEMLSSLKKNRWAAALLQPRFTPFISFELFDTKEQLDATPELKQHWRSLPLFKSGPKFAAGLTEEEQDPRLKIVGSVSAAQYDRLSVILSDMARFLLCHRFGGIYLDADTLLLRDFDELFNWPGAFAYRWSRMREYNSAVLKMNRGSALGSFILKTALANELDFHPHSIWQFLSKTDPPLHHLLLRLPDALFDPAWLNTEYYQRDKPPSPYFTSFNDFFTRLDRNTSLASKPAHSEFFAGAYAYHYHNNWWTPFDPSQNFPNIEAGKSTPLFASNDEMSWSASLKREWEAFLRGEVPNMYGEVLPANESGT